MYKEIESGRSMVEMLGVLAIIGVLSVAGIAGYTTAMNKHRANQILNGASIRAIVVSTQIQRGATAPTLGEFTDNEIGGAKFGTGVQNAEGTGDWNKDTDKRFSLTLENVPDDICDQMKASVGQNSIIREINEGCTTITYNNDLSPNDLEPSGPKGDECTDSCSGGAKCENGYCECPSGSIWQPSDNSGNGECKTGLTGDCATNADCKEAGKYCEIIGGGCSPSQGECMPLDNGTEATYNGKTFLYASTDMSWWSARNWCLAHGKRLASLSDLGITGGYEEGFCSESECTGADWDALKVAFGYDDYYYWTNNSYDSCYAFPINAHDQFVSGTERYKDQYFLALCR